MRRGDASRKSPGWTFSNLLGLVEAMQRLAASMVWISVARVIPAAYLLWQRRVDRAERGR